MVTPTAGGRNQLNSAETALAYKSAVLSKDRIVTEEDIRAFCHYQLGEQVAKVAVQKGVMVHPGTQQGFLKTMDVIIYINRQSYVRMRETGEFRFWCEKLKFLLEEKSTALMPFNVSIKEDS